MPISKDEFKRKITNEALLKKILDLEAKGQLIRNKKGKIIGIKEEKVQKRDEQLFGGFTIKSPLCRCGHDVMNHYPFPEQVHHGSVSYCHIAGCPCIKYEMDR